jgi:hypothetical protein
MIAFLSCQPCSSCQIASAARSTLVRCPVERSTSDLLADTRQSSDRCVPEVLVVNGQPDRGGPPGQLSFPRTAARARTGQVFGIQPSTSTRPTGRALRGHPTTCPRGTAVILTALVWQPHRHDPDNRPPTHRPASLHSNTVVWSCTRGRPAFELEYG